MYRVKRLSFFFVSIVMILAFLAVFLIAGTVYAEDGAPPEEPEPPAQETTPEANVSTDTAVESEVPAVEVGEDLALAETPDEQAVETPPAEIDAEESVETATEIVETGEAEVPAEETGAVLEDTAEMLAENEIVLVDDGGEAIDLVSQDSVEAVTGGDPWWIVAGVKYAYVKSSGACPSDTTFGVTCFVHATTPISAALTYMDQNNLIPTDGILHVESDTYNESNISVDGSIVAGTSWGNLSRLKGIISEGTSADTLLNGGVTISNTTLGFTLQGFSITGALYIHDNLGILTLNDLEVTNTSGNGIQVSNHNGAVNVTKVESSHNKYYGMTVNNTSGTLGVTITNSEFSHNNDSNPSNYWGGLIVESNGIITLNGVAACNNDGNGAFLNAAKGTVVKNSAFNGNLAVMGGVGYGLYINNTYTTNNISLENVQADNNNNYGIYAYSAANVTLKNVNASLNGVGSGYQGVLINNRSGSGTVSVTNSTFNQNGDDGLRILSYKNVTLNGVSTLENDGNGTYINNCDWSGTVCLGTGSVSITGNLPNYFNDNDEYGLQILSGGNVLLSNFQAGANKFSGINIRNDYTGRSGTVTLNVTYVPTVGTWTNIASSNLQSGLLVDSFGNISLDKCIFESNGDFGANLDNSSASSAKTVTVKNSSFTDNGSSGLVIDSKGNITVNNSNAFENPSGRGLLINNTYGTGSVTISGVGTVKNDYSGNNSYGIEIESAGVVALSNVDATQNLYGIRIDNTYGVGKAVTIANVDCSETTSSEGLQVNSKGAITITDILSNNNASSTGAILHNDDAATPQTVKITRGQFSDNQSSLGLQIYSLGTVTLSSVQADRNVGNGAWIDTCIYNGGWDQCEGSGGLTITGTGNSFSGNDGYGLYIMSRNSVALSNVTVDNNGYTGVSITHTYSNSTGTITLSSTGGSTNSISNNASYGMYIYSYGTVSLANFNANNNISNGIYLTNQESPTPKDITISNARINNNQNTGLYLYSKGIVTLSGVEVVDSSKHYWEINDETGQNVHDRLPYEQTYDEVWWFEGSASQSVSIDLVSPDFDAYVELYDSEWHLLSADDDSGGGTDASLTYILPSLQIYFIKVTSAVEGEYGEYTVSMDGSGPTTTYNYFYGAMVNNGSGSGDVRVNKHTGLGYGLVARDNNYEGAYIYTNGNINLNGVNATYNGYIGMEMYNSGVENKSISLTNCVFDLNDDRGVYIESKGAITWSGGSASQNVGDYGAMLWNANAATSKTFTISNVVFNDNKTSGMEGYSLGKITLTNVGASRNLSGSGVTLDNCRYSGSIPGCQGSGDVVISGTYGILEFNENSYFGLNVASRGAISLSNVDASKNKIDDGVYLNNDYENATAGVSIKTTSPLTPSQFNENWRSGVQVFTNGAVTLANLKATGNTTNTGIYVENNSAAQLVNISKVTTGANGNRGLSVISVGAITLDYVEDTGGNATSGIHLSNSSAATPQPVTVNRTRSNGNTNANGLYIEAYGLVTLNNVFTSGNRYGTDIGNNITGSTAGVKLLSTFGENIFNDNTYDGLLINSLGDVTLSKVTANWNGNQGVEVHTTGKLTAATVYAYRNSRDGMFVVANNGVSISGLQSYNNGITSNYDGLSIQVNSGSPVSVLNSFITGNYGDGISLTGNAAPVLTGTCYYGNDINNAGGDMNLRIY